jgi:hypothetical protein
MRQIIHQGDAGIGKLSCGIKPVGRTPADEEANWAWKSELVTCKRCLANKALAARAARQAEAQGFTVEVSA